MKTSETESRAFYSVSWALSHSDRNITAGKLSDDHYWDVYGKSLG